MLRAAKIREKILQLKVVSHPRPVQKSDSIAVAQARQLLRNPALPPRGCFDEHPASGRISAAWCLFMTNID